MPAWLTARPVAHRGLHDISRGIVENTASAFQAAIAAGYPIECDLRITADGEAMVHHDAMLGRVVEGAGRLAGITAAQIRKAPIKGSSDHTLTLGELRDLVAGHVPLVIELKSDFDRDRRLVARTADVLRRYAGEVALMSFDPGQVGMIRELAPGLPRGLIAQRPDAVDDDHPDDDTPAPSAPRYVMQALAARLQFLAYRVQDLPSTLPQMARSVLGMPLLTWTVRTPEDRTRAGRYADQMIFEGFRP